MVEFEQIKPKWCPFKTCQFKIHSQNILCFGELSKQELHDGVVNTHRMCIKESSDNDDPWLFHLMINKGDAYSFYRLLKFVFGFNNV